MVLSVMKKFFVKDLISLRGSQALQNEGVTVGGESFNTRDWNPFLYAVGYSKNEVMRYMTSTTSNGLG
jgi:hypothetical protein